MTTSATYTHGSALLVSWLVPGGSLKAYALGPVRREVLHYVIVDSIDGSVSTYRANDQNGFPAIDESAPMWDAPSGMIRALFETSVREYANQQAEDSRYRELIEARSELSDLRASREVMKAAIMKEMMERAAEIADSEGFCGEYDRLAEALGYEGRERDWTVYVDVSMTVPVSVRATSSDSAGDEITESEVDDAIREYIAVNSVTWSVDTVERS